MKTPIAYFRSAYGQLVLLVFLPVVSLALVGGYLVFSEVRRSVLSEQEALAQATLIRYESVVRPIVQDVLLGRYSDQYIMQRLDSMAVDWFDVKPSDDILLDIFGASQTRQDWLKRIVVTDHQGKILINTGLDRQWYDFDKTASHFERISTRHSTIYGVAMMVGGEKFWLFVDMDNKPLVITFYRVALALATTGLITLLLLLLILNIYSKRWIAPIYEMRLQLQKLSADNINRLTHVTTDGEFDLLQKDFIRAMKRLEVSFEELKSHAQETEEYLQKAFDEMEMQNISIRQARDNAISISQAKSAFLANISHELRTPLNSIDGFINLLARHDGLSGEQNLYVQTIKKSSAHLLALVNDVLDFSKIEAGKLVLDSHEFDLYAVVYDVVDMLSPSALEKHLRLCVLFYNDVPNHIIGDSLRVKQILTNLVGNAIKFTDTGGVVVKVGLSDDRDDFLHISVEDTGKGVSESDKEQLFQSFSQGDLSVTRRYGGTGLGLVISKQLTQMMGGHIGFWDNNSENVAKTGATFWFDMPIVLGDDDSKNSPIIIPDMLMSTPMRLLVWINHAPTTRGLQAYLAGTKADIHLAIGLADLLEQLDNPNHGFDWVIVDYFGQDAAQDDVGAILRQIRGRYQGNLSAYGYQVGMDSVMLKQCDTHALYEPLDKRQLYAMLTNQANDIGTRQTRFVGSRVLAVDDHAPNLLVLKALLAELEVEVVTANNGFDAIAIMTKAITGADDKIDLVFMDIQMPRMSGLEASVQIRKVEQTHKADPVPIIALTAHGLSDEKDRLVASGMSDYVGKPIGLGQLVQILQKWLDADNAPILLTNATPAPSDVDDTDSQHEVLPDVDWADALERSAHKEDLARTLLAMIVENIENDKRDLLQAWSDKDRTALADITHRVVGASRYTGVPRLRRASEQFEQMCRQDVHNVSVSQFVAMRPLYRELMDALESLAQVDLDKV